MKIEESLRDYHPRNTMKSLWLLLLAVFSVVLFQASPVHSIGEQILHEVPGYAKRMMGTFGNFFFFQAPHFKFVAIFK